MKLAKSPAHKKPRIHKASQLLGGLFLKRPNQEVVPSKKRYFDSSNVKKSLHNLTCEMEEKIGENKRDGDSTEPEIRVDVYRPTSKPSSLTYNKKYIRSLRDTDLPVIATNKRTQRGKHNTKCYLNDLEDEYEYSDK